MDARNPTAKFEHNKIKSEHGKKPKAEEESLAMLNSKIVTPLLKNSVFSFFLPPTDHEYLLSHPTLPSVPTDKTSHFLSYQYPNYGLFSSNQNQESMIFSANEWDELAADVKSTAGLYQLAIMLDKMLEEERTKKSTAVEVTLNNEYSDSAFPNYFGKRF